MQCRESLKFQSKMNLASEDFRGWGRQFPNIYRDIFLSCREEQLPPFCYLSATRMIVPFFGSALR